MNSRKPVLTLFLCITIISSGCVEVDEEEALEFLQSEEFENISETAINETEATEILEEIQDEQQTDLEIRTVFEGSNGNIYLSLRNTGTTNLTFQEDIDLFIEEVDYDIYDRNDNFKKDKLTGEIGCFSENMTLKTGQSTAELDRFPENGCDTGIEFPSAFDESIHIELQLQGSHKSWTHTCEPDTGEDTNC